MKVGAEINVIYYSSRSIQAPAAPGITMEYSETERIWSHVGGQLNFQDSAKCSHRMMRSSINDVHKMCSRDSTIIHETLTGRTESKESVLQILTTIIKDPIDVNLGRINLFTARFTEVSRCLPIPASVVN